MKAVVMGIFAGFLCGCGPADAEVSFLPDKPVKGSVFRSYEAKGRSKWAKNWTSNFDLTGVSWNDARTATLIAPSFVVMAKHFMRPQQVPVMFHDREGKPCERYIVGAIGLPDYDVAVAKLNLPVAAGIKSYSFAKPEQITPGRPVLISDQTMTLSVHEINDLRHNMVVFRFVQKLDPVYRRNLIVGDSGNPSFLIDRGELLLLETHTTGGPGAGPCYANPKIQAEVKRAMAELGE
jgi:hypothetical protein